MYDPRIAVLIPAYNEELVIEGTIDALIAADCDLRDIFVVDDRSTDKTAEITLRSGVNVYTVPVNGGKAKAQIQALDHFKLIDNYDWIIFLDGDTKVDTYFINAMYMCAKSDPSIALYVGQVKSVKNDHIFSASRAFDYTYGQDVTKHGQSNFGVIFVSPGCSSMYRADILKKLRIDHLTLAEDMDLTMQVHRIGEKVKYVPEAYVNTQDPSTFTDYHKQIMRWYRGYWQVVLKHKVFSWGKKQRVDLYMMLITADAIIFNRILWILVLGLLYPWALLSALVIDLFVSVAISFYVSVRTRRLDVIYKFPVYYWLGYVNFYAYFRAFVEIIILKKELLSWNKVKRYEFDSRVNS